LISGLAEKPVFFAISMLVILTGFSWVSTQLFSARASYIHMGALIGSIMVANVFIGIIPPQRDFVKAIESNSALPVKALQFAKLRSMHNNYFTLPVLFCMISNHYPVLYGHEHSWLILIAIFAITASARQYFNLKHRGIRKPEILVVCASLFLVLCSMIGWGQYKEQIALAVVQVDNQNALAIAEVHCGVCHSQSPTFPGFSAPPQGIPMTNEEEFKVIADKAITAISSEYMPLGNLTGITVEERQALLAWLHQLKE